MSLLSPQSLQLSQVRLQAHVFVCQPEMRFALMCFALLAIATKAFQLGILDAASQAAGTAAGPTQSGYDRWRGRGREDKAAASKRSFRSSDEHVIWLFDYTHAT